MGIRTAEVVDLDEPDHVPGADHGLQLNPVGVVLYIFYSSLQEKETTLRNNSVASITHFECSQMLGPLTSLDGFYLMQGSLAVTR